MRPAIRFVHKKFKDKPLIGIEVGVWAGYHATKILNSLNMKKLYLIDIWGPYIEEKIEYNSTEYYEEVLQKFKGKENVIIKKQDSIDASKQFEDESLDFVYIDASHQYEFVKKDIESWFPKIKKGGILSGHDYKKEWLGVVKAVDEFIKKTKYILNASENDWWIEK